MSIGGRASAVNAAVYDYLTKKRAHLAAATEVAAARNALSKVETEAQTALSLATAARRALLDMLDDDASKDSE